MDSRNGHGGRDSGRFSIGGQNKKPRIVIDAGHEVVETNNAC